MLQSGSHECAPVCLLLTGAGCYSRALLVAVCAATLPVQAILLRARPSGHMQQIQCTAMAWQRRRAYQMERPVGCNPLAECTADI